MAAWELDLRIQMAEKQRKYNEINRKLLKIQKIKKKSIKKDKDKIKIKKMKKKIKYEVQNIEDKISSSRGYKQAELTERGPAIPTPPRSPPSPASPPISSSPPDPEVPEMPEEPNLPESTEMSEVVEEEDKEPPPPPHAVNSFTETFQKFKQSYLSRTGGDSRLSASKVKKIPTLENWRTIMQGNRKKKENEEENKSSEETCFNNNLFENSTRVKTAGEKYLLHHKKRIKSELYEEEDHVKVSESKHSEDQVDQDNNNKLINWQPEETEETFLSFKKKLKKKYKEQLSHKVVEAETTAGEASERRKKKRKKEKKEKRREKEKKIRRKERKERKERKVAGEDCPPLLVPEVESSVPAGSTSDLPPSLDPEPEPGCCLLAESDLVDGLRVILRLGGHFYTSRLTEISPPDIYGVQVEKTRGNKPHILSREEVLHQAVSYSGLFIKSFAHVLPSLSRLLMFGPSVSPP